MLYLKLHCEAYFQQPFYAVLLYTAVSLLQSNVRRQWITLRGIRNFWLAVCKCCVKHWHLPVLLQEIEFQWRNICLYRQRRSTFFRKQTLLIICIPHGRWGTCYFIVRHVNRYNECNWNRPYFDINPKSRISLTDKTNTSISHKHSSSFVHQHMPNYLSRQNSLKLPLVLKLWHRHIYGSNHVELVFLHATLCKKMHGKMMQQENWNGRVSNRT